MKKITIGEPAPDFLLPAVDGHEYSLQSFNGKNLIVIVFTCNHCPYAQAYEDRLVQLQNEFAAQQVQLVAINSNDTTSYPEDSFDNMIKRARQKGFNFPYLRDENQRTAHAYGAEYTPEVFVLNAKHHVRYIGRIDDNWQHPDKVHIHNLRDAITTILAHKPIENPVTHAIGCTIKWKL